MGSDGTSGKMATVARSPLHPSTSHFDHPQRESLPQQRAQAGSDARIYKPVANCCRDSRVTMMIFLPLRHLRAHDGCVCMCACVHVFVDEKKKAVPLNCLWERCERQIFTLFTEDRAIYALAKENKIHKWSLKCAEGFKVFAICWDITRFCCLLSGFFGAQVCGE